MKDAFCTSGSSPGSKPAAFTPSSSESPHNLSSDFTVIGSGCDSVYLLCPETDAARAWIDEHLPKDVTWFGQGVAIENRYFWKILLAVQDAGFLVGR